MYIGFYLQVDIEGAFNSYHTVVMQVVSIILFPHPSKKVLPATLVSVDVRY